MSPETGHEVHGCDAEGVAAITPFACRACPRPFSLLLPFVRDSSVLFHRAGARDGVLECLSENFRWRSP
jgi:hypothetical protein